MSFFILDKKLDLIQGYLQDLPKLDIIVSFTPLTVSYLAKSLQYLIDKGFGDRTRFNIRPAIIPDIKWQAFDFKTFDEQIFKIAEIFVKNFKKRKYLNICANEDLPLDFCFLNLIKVGDNQYCGLGRETLGISIEGKIYPCYVFAAAQNSQKKKFIFGDVANSSLNQVINKIRKFHQNQSNRCQGCLFWNWVVGKNLY